MRKHLIINFLFLATIMVSGCSVVFCQKNTPSLADTTLKSSYEMWKVKLHNKMFGGAGAVDFGPYKTLLIEKLDSPSMKTKDKGSAQLGLFRENTYRKSKYYRVLMENGTDTIETLCSVFSIRNEENKTVAGGILKFLTSKNDDDDEPDENGVLGYWEIINGVITPKTDPDPWNFNFIFGQGDSSVSVRHRTNEAPQSQSGFTGFLKNNSDSIYIDPNKNLDLKISGNKNVYFSYTETYALVNQKGELFTYIKGSGVNNPTYYTWMRKDMDNSYRQSIVLFLSVIFIRQQYVKKNKPN